MPKILRTTLFVIGLCLFVVQAWAQCTLPSSYIQTNKSGEWGQCGIGTGAIVWADGALALSGVYGCATAPLWSSTGGTSGLMSNRSHVINNGHTITVSVAANSTWHRTRGLHIMAGGTLTIGQTMLIGNSTLTSVAVCGTLNITGGTTDFNALNLVVKNGGVLNVNAGSFEVNSITIESGGTINLNGGILVRNGMLTVNTGGLINITNGSSRISYDGFGTPSTRLDGTINCNSVLTSLNYSNFRLGNTSVTNGTSTGRIRTSSAYVPAAELTIAAANNFFGFNSDYGGTVEYYGASNITLASTGSRSQYYDLEVNITGVGNGLSLGNGGCTNIVGVLYIKSGNLKTNNKILKLRGTIRYTGSTFIEGSVLGEIHFLGKIGNVTTGCAEVSAGVVSGGISSQNATVDIRQPELRMSATAGGNATLDKLLLFREDVIHLRSNLTVTTLELDRGILRTYSPSIINVTGTASANLNDLHNTTGFNSLSGYVSGHLRRVITAGGSYDFPVGYPNADNYSTYGPRHRRLTLDVSAVSGAGSLTVSFVPPTSDCNGALNSMTENGFTYLTIHPEGHWNMTPDAGITSATYTAKLYVHGFTSPALVDNLFSPLKRVTGSGCGGWSIPGGSSVPATGATGRILETSGGAQVGHCDRLSITGFSDIAIGIMDAPLPVSLLTFQAQPIGTVVNTTWETQEEVGTASFTLERADATGEYAAIAQLPARGSQNGWQYAYEDREPLFGTSYYRLRINNLDGSTALGPVVAVRRVASLPSINLQPNPTETESELVLEVDQAGDLEVTLYDVTGQVRYQQPATALRPGTHRIALNRDRLALGNGVYMLEVKLGTETRMLKWVVR